MGLQQKGAQKKEEKKERNEKRNKRANEQRKDLEWFIDAHLVIKRGKGTRVLRWFLKPQIKRFSVLSSIIFLSVQL
jgi:hypothetical protein